MKQQSVGFDEYHVLHSLKHYLPGQNPLKDFVHHNSLHSFQEQDFYKGIFSASKIFGIQVTLNLNEYRKLYNQGRIKPEILDKVIVLRKGESQLENFKDKLLKNDYKPTYNPRIGQLRAFWKTNYEIDLDNRVQPIFFRILGNYLDQGIALWHFPFDLK